MTKTRKITVEVPAGLLEMAQRVSGTDITGTVRIGLQLLASSPAYAKVRKSRGRLRLLHTWKELKADR